MQWIILFIAGGFEICWAIGLKYSEGFSRLVPSAITIVTMLLSLFFLAQALKTLPLGTAYAVWTGIGTVGTVILGIFLFKEPMDLARIIGVILIVSGIVILKLVSPH